MGIEAIAEAFGPGTYRLTRWASSEETRGEEEQVVHVEFGIDPAAVQRDTSQGDTPAGTPEPEAGETPSVLTLKKTLKKLVEDGPSRFGIRAEAGEPGADQA